jgi:hypothetical protein
MGFRYPPVYNTLHEREKAAVDSVVTRIRRLENALCLIWGGSTSLQPTRPPLTDVDLWLVMREIGSTKQRLYDDFQEIDGISFVHDGGYLPWLGELLSLFFPPNCTFSIDVGICDLDGLHTANPGPKPFFLWGESIDIASRLKVQKYERSPQQRMMEILVNVLKIKKSLMRGHIWNVIEYLSRARRELMGLLVELSDSKAIYYLRPDRDIEDLIDERHLVRLAETCPQYSAVTVAECASKIIHQCLDWAEKERFDWPLTRELANQDQWFVQFSKSKGSTLR